MRGLGRWGRAVTLGAALAAVAATVFNCASNAKTSGGPKVKNVAVVEAEVDAQSGADASLNPAEVRQITAVLRKEAVKNLPQGKYNIMTTETVMSQGSAVLEECSDENCVIKVGAAIGADYIVRGTVSKFGNMLTVSVDMYETNDGNLVASSELVRSENIVELLDRTAGASAEMYRVFENPKSAGVKQTVVYQTPVQTPTPTPTPKPTPTPAPAPMPKPTPTPTPAPTNQKSSVDDSGTLTDGRDGKQYRTVVIGGKRWMAENLNYEYGISWCYGDQYAMCYDYGRLYDWNTAQTACMSGWHLPSRKEWDKLVMTVGGSSYTAKRLKSKNGWNDDCGYADGPCKSGNGTDDFGFSALPGGQRYSTGVFERVGDWGFWWTATNNGSKQAYNMFINTGNNLIDDFDGKAKGFSVRCVADN